MFWNEIFAEFVENAENSIKFVVAIGVSVACICLYFICKDTKNTSLLQLYEYFSYVELTLILADFGWVQCCSVKTQIRD